ncbi:hypothetical protein [Photorhabdus akhurstii]
MNSLEKMAHKYKLTGDDFKSPKLTDGLLYPLVMLYVASAIIFLLK